jgi:hypothetical protein
LLDAAVIALTAAFPQTIGNFRVGGRHGDSAA